jgi:hypothetical protein
VLKALAATERDLLISADGQRLLTKSATSICAAKRSGSRIVPGAEFATIASQPIAHAAWHPSDPRCFVTVGGPPSKDLPETYRHNGIPRQPGLFCRRYARGRTARLGGGHPIADRGQSTCARDVLSTFHEQANRFIIETSKLSLRYNDPMFCEICTHFPSPGDICPHCGEVVTPAR